MRKLILDKVRLLGTTEHKEIFALLQAHNIAFSSNSNGVFINLSTVPDDVLATVKAFVDYCAMNKTGLDEYEKRLQECKITHRFDSITSSTPTEPRTQHLVHTAPHRPPPATTTIPSPTIPTPPTPAVVTCPRVSTASILNTLPSVLVNGRFQATKKRFARRKIVERKQTDGHGQGHGHTHGQGQSGHDPAILMPEAYTYVHLAGQRVELSRPRVERQNSKGDGFLSGHNARILC